MDDQFVQFLWHDNLIGLAPMPEIASNEEFFRMLHQLIEAWCDRRCLRALSASCRRILDSTGSRMGGRGLTMRFGMYSSSLGMS